MANSKICSVCTRAAELGVDLSSEEKTKVAWAEQLGVSEASVRRHFNHGDAPKVHDTQSPVSDRARGLSLTETIEESSSGSRSVTAVRDRPITLQDARDWIKSSGDDPESYNLSVRSIAYGDGLFSNKMSAWPKKAKTGAAESSTVELNIQVPETLDPNQLLQSLRRINSQPTRPVAGSGTGAFVVSLNDTQFGKSEGGGTPATLARLNKAVELAILRVQELRTIGRELGTLVIIGGGDIVEGCVIYPNQSYSIDLDRRGQINTAVAAILSTIDRLAPLFEKVVVLAARGNHGENRINGNRTTLYDNDDTLVFEMAQRATDRDPHLQHVKYIIAQDEAGVYADVAGWRLATTHGDVYGRGSGPIDKRAQGWYKNMAMARNPIGQADVLITHHFHHDKMSDWGACIWRQTPALDGGSLWFEQTTGEYSEAGMLSFVMSPEARYADELVLR